MTKEKKETKWDDLIDAPLEEHGISHEAVLGENGLIAQLKKRVVERGLARHSLGSRAYLSGTVCTARGFEPDRRGKSFRRKGNRPARGGVRRPYWPPRLPLARQRGLTTP